MKTRKQQLLFPNNWVTHTFLGVLLYLSFDGPWQSGLLIAGAGLALFVTTSFLFLLIRPCFPEAVFEFSIWAWIALWSYFGVVFLKIPFYGAVIFYFLIRPIFFELKKPGTLFALDFVRAGASLPWTLRQAGFMGAVVLVFSAFREFLRLEFRVPMTESPVYGLVVLGIISILFQRKRGGRSS